MELLLPSRRNESGIDREKMVRRAIEEILARLKSETFNSLEITRVAISENKPRGRRNPRRLRRGGCQFGVVNIPFLSS